MRCQVNEVITEEFGPVMVVAVGATVVGSIHFTAGVGTHLNKGDELGFFAFGGSTVLTLFQVRRWCRSCSILQGVRCMVQGVVLV